MPRKLSTGAPASLPRAPPRVHRVPGAPACASRMNEAPLPHKGIRRGPQVSKRLRSAQPAPSGAADKEIQGLKGSASLNLPVPLPKTKAHPGLSRPPRARGHFGERPPRRYCSESRERARPGGGHTGTCPSWSSGVRPPPSGPPPGPSAREVCAPARHALTSPRAVQLVAALCAYWWVHRHQPGPR